MVMGIVVAVVAFLLVVLFGGGSKSTGPSGNRNVDVVVTLVDIPPGTLISQQLVHIVKYATDQVPTGAFLVLDCPPKAPATCATPVGQYAAIAISKNSPLSGSIVVSDLGKLKAAPKPYLDIPAGEVGMSIPAGGELQTVGGYIQPGDHVDVIVNFNGVWKLTVQNLVLQRSGSVAANTGQGLTSSYIVYVSPVDAEVLSEVFVAGTYKFVLRSQKDIADTSQASTPGFGTKEFQSKYGFPATPK